MITGILGGAAMALIASWSFGRILLRALAIELSRIETELFAFLAGSACLSTLVFLLCTVNLARKGLFVALSAVATVLAVRIVWKAPVRDKAFLSPRQLLWIVVPFVPYAVLYFFNALTPETSPDGVTYHLGSVLRWWSDRGFARYTDNMFGSLPQGLEMIFLVAFSIGRHSAAKLVHFAFLLILPWLLLSYGVRFGVVRPFLVAAVLLFVSPVVGMAGTTSYVDVAIACLTFGLFYALRLWDQTDQQRLLVVAGLLAGFGYAVKYTGAIGIIYAVGFIAWKLRRDRTGILRPMALFLICAAIPALPWMIKNLLWVGNPFSPFFNSWFPNAHVHISFEKDLGKAMALYPELKSRWQLPWILSIGGQHIGGLFGPWLLLTPLSLLSLRSAEGRRLLTAAILFGLPALTNSATRFLFPFAVFAAPAIGIALEYLTPRLAPIVIAISALVSWPDIVSVYADPSAWRLSGMPVAEALRIVPEEKHLQHWVEGYDMARVIDQLTPKQARILRLCAVPQAYTTRLLWNGMESADAQLAFHFIWAGFDHGFQPYRRKSFRFPEIAVQAVRVVDRGHSTDAWNVNEMSVYHGGAAIARQPDWRFSAAPNRWDAARAFDNNEATFWSTWQTIEPRMWLQASFPKAVAIEEVAVECADLCGDDLFAEGLGVDGRWRTLAEKAEVQDRPPAAGLRRAAMHGVKLLGFDYVVAGHEEVPGKDLWERPEEWGLAIVAETAVGRLYKIR